MTYSKLENSKHKIIDYFDNLLTRNFYDAKVSGTILKKFVTYRKKGVRIPQTEELQLLENLYYPYSGRRSLNYLEVKEELEDAFLNLNTFIKVFIRFPTLRPPIAILFPKEVEYAARRADFDDYTNWEEVLSNWGSYGEEKYKKDFHSLVFNEFKTNKKRRQFIRQLWVLIDKQADMGSDYLNDKEQAELIKSILMDPEYKQFLN
jgi:hypothetical protein